VQVVACAFFFVFKPRGSFPPSGMAAPSMQASLFLLAIASCMMGKSPGVRAQRYEAGAAPGCCGDQGELAALECVPTAFGCAAVAWAGCPASFPYGHALRIHGQVLPEQVATLSMLSTARHVIAIAPASSFILHAVAQARAASLSILHHDPAFVSLLQVSLTGGTGLDGGARPRDAGERAAGREAVDLPQPQHIRVLHGSLHSSASGLVSSSGPRAFADYFRPRHGEGACAWREEAGKGVGGLDTGGGDEDDGKAPEPPPRVDLRDLLPRAAAREMATPRALDSTAAATNVPTLIAVLGSSSEESAQAAAGVCAALRDCILWAKLAYDGEGAVFSEAGLQVLGVARALEEGRLATSLGEGRGREAAGEGAAAGGAAAGGAAAGHHACFWHMSDWLPGAVQERVAREPSSQDVWALHLPPQLDVVCLPPHLSARAPSDTRITWQVCLNTTT
jgi:hypothetical protein